MKNIIAIIISVFLLMPVAQAGFIEDTIEENKGLLPWERLMKDYMYHMDGNLKALLNVSRGNKTGTVYSCEINPSENNGAFAKGRNLACSAEGFVASLIKLEQQARELNNLPADDEYRKNVMRKLKEVTNSSVYVKRFINSNY